MKKRIAIISTLGAAGVLALGGAGIAIAAASSGEPGSSFGAVVAASDGGSSATPSPVPSTSGTPFLDDDGDGDDHGGHGDHDGDDRDDHSGRGHDGDHQDDDALVSDADRAAASAAALAATGGGTVTDVDADDDSTHAWEVDVRLDSGADLEVKLDASFTVLSVQND
ncbi:PepSY domain-containing protein [Microterricola viridarii]|uniref:Peptidase propeptide and YPEB domain-containing protein n=1 Tax=Microterricola viridarii TaxID=412690 RepID=A0A1H1Y8Y5_9MICO|nr:PepSY domain-containing protein [Microterricola viridarii]SDT17719.1 Peptidase propeptide and YPEB domain-containing protein [Microterricola viridarii]